MSWCDLDDVFHVGCPFACMRDSELETTLKTVGVDSGEISNIMQFYREHHIEVRKGVCFNG